MIAPVHRVGDAAVVGDVRAAHGRGEHAVAEGHPAQRDGPAKVRVFFIILLSSCCLI